MMSCPEGTGVSIHRLSTSKSAIVNWFVQFNEQWQPCDAIVGSPISKADHPLLTSTPVVPAVGLPLLQPSSGKIVDIDVPC